MGWDKFFDGIFKFFRPKIRLNVHKSISLFNRFRSIVSTEQTIIILFTNSYWFSFSNNKSFHWLSFPALLGLTSFCPITNSLPVSLSRGLVGGGLGQTSNFPSWARFLAWSSNNFNNVESLAWLPFTRFIGFLDFLFSFAFKIFFTIGDSARRGYSPII